MPRMLRRHPISTLARCLCAVTALVTVLSSENPAHADQDQYLTSEPGTNRMRIFDLDGTVESTFTTGVQGQFTPNHACVGPNGDRIYVPTYFGTSSVLIFNRHTGEQIGEIDHPTFVSPAWVGVHPNGNLIISDFDGGRVWEYNPNFDQFVGEFIEPGHLTSAHSIVINDDGSILVLDYWAGQIVRYHENGDFDQILQNGPWLFGPLDMVPSPDGTRLYVTNAGYSDVRSFDRETGAPAEVLIPTGILNNCEGLHYTPNGDLLVCSAPAQFIKRFNPHTGAFIDNFIATGTGCVDILFLPAQCPADINNSDGVDVDDLLNMLSNWGPCENCEADLDHNGAVDVNDLLNLLAAWGPCN